MRCTKCSGWSQHFSGYPIVLEIYECCREPHVPQILVSQLKNRKKRHDPSTSLQHLKAALAIGPCGKEYSTHGRSANVENIRPGYLLSVASAFVQVAKRSTETKQSLHNRFIERGRVVRRFPQLAQHSLQRLASEISIGFCYCRAQLLVS